MTHGEAGQPAYREGGREGDQMRWDSRRCWRIITKMRPSWWPTLHIQCGFQVGLQVWQRLRLPPSAALLRPVLR